MKAISDFRKQFRSRSYFFSIIFVLLCVFSSSKTFAQESSADTTVYSFLLLKDGSQVAGKIISKDVATITINDFSLGQLTINKVQIIKETDVKKGGAYCFTMIAGQKYCGYVIASDSLISVKTESLGIIHIKPNLIKEIQNAADVKIVDGQEWFANPQPNRYFFVPSAIPLKKGDGYYQNVMLDLNTVNYGLSDHISIGGGFAIPWAYMGSFKVGYQVAKNIYVGGGAVVAGTFFNIRLGVAAAYGLITYGNNENNFTISSGYGLSKRYVYNPNNYSGSSEWTAGKRPMFTISGMTRVGKRISLITENWIFPMTTSHYHYNYPNPTTYTYTYDYQAAISFGFRTMWQKNSFDLGLVSVVGNQFTHSFNGVGLILPYLDYVLKF